MIERLIIVAGPTCCGKTRLINYLRAGKLKEIQKKLEIENFQAWSFQDAYYLNYKKLNELLEVPELKLLMHWTIPLPRILIFLRNIALFGSYDRRARIRLLKSVKYIDILTLFADAASLTKRVNLRKEIVLKEVKKSKIFYLKKKYKLYNKQVVEKFYSDPKRYLGIYKKWFNYLEKNLKINNHYLVELNDEPILRKIEEWPEIVKNWNLNLESLPRK